MRKAELTGWLTAEANARTNGADDQEEDPKSGEEEKAVWRSGRERRIEVVVEDGLDGGAWRTRVDPLHPHLHMQPHRVVVAGPVSRSLTQVAHVDAFPAARGALAWGARRAWSAWLVVGHGIVSLSSFVQQHMQGWSWLR